MIRPRQTVYPFADKRSGFVFRLFLGIKKGGACGVFLASVSVLDRERQGDGVVKKLSLGVVSLDKALWDCLLTCPSVARDIRFIFTGRDDALAVDTSGELECGYSGRIKKL